MLRLSTSVDRRRLQALTLVGASALLSLACTHKPPKPRTTTTRASTTATTEPRTTTSTTLPPVGNPVTYDLANFTISLTGGQIRPGVNTVTATNVGTAPHEVNFVRAVDAASLPTTPTGGVDFTRIPSADQLGVLRVAAGTTRSGMFNFTPGSYIVLCNVGAGGANAHFARGNFLQFTVT